MFAMFKNCFHFIKRKISQKINHPPGEPTGDGLFFNGQLTVTGQRSFGGVVQVEFVLFRRILLGRICRVEANAFAAVGLAIAHPLDLCPGKGPFQGSFAGQGDAGFIHEDDPLFFLPPGEKEDHKSCHSQQGQQNAEIGLLAVQRYASAKQIDHRQQDAAPKICCLGLIIL